MADVAEAALFLVDFFLLQVKYWILMLPLPRECPAARTLEDNQGWGAGGGQAGGKAGGKSGGDH